MCNIYVYMCNIYICIYVCNIYIYILDLIYIISYFTILYYIILNYIILYYIILCVFLQYCNDPTHECTILDLRRNIQEPFKNPIGSCTQIMSVCCANVHTYTGKNKWANGDINQEPI
jgi:hypothetical protein